MKKMLLIILVLSLLVAACQGEEENVSENPFLGGTTGLRMNFVENAPPAEVFDNGQYPFEIALQLENVGEEDVASEDIQINLGGIDPTEFGKTNNDMTLSPQEDLTASKKNSAGEKELGTVTEVSVQDLNYEADIVGMQVQRPVVASICYEYGTTAVADICILKDVLRDDSSVCTISETKAIYNSGAPIQVTSLSERSAGENKVEFDFTIENLGSVKNIYKTESGCVDQRSLQDVVHVEVTGIDDLECQGLGTDNLVTLINNQKKIKCTFEIDSETDYEKSISINLDYAVSDDVSTQLTIKNTE